MASRTNNRGRRRRHTCCCKQTHESPVAYVPVSHEGRHHLLDTIKKISHVTAMEVIADRVSLCESVCVCVCVIVQVHCREMVRRVYYY